MRDRLKELLKNAPRNTRAFYDQYADYLFANGVIVPPCKVGTTIYMIVEKRAKISRDYFRFIKTTRLTYNNLERVIRAFGKTVFLTKEEAEQALKGGIQE